MPLVIMRGEDGRYKQLFVIVRVACKLSCCRNAQSTSLVLVAASCGIPEYEIHCTSDLRPGRLSCFVPATRTSCPDSPTS